MGEPKDMTAEEAYEMAERRIEVERREEAGFIVFNGLPLKTLPPEISELQNLTVLSVVNTNLTDAAPLSGLKNLWELYLSNTNLADASPLSGLQNLELLDLSNTNITDATPLSGLQKLQTLGLNNTNLADASPLSDLQNLKGLDLENTNVTDPRPLRTLINLVKDRWSNGIGFKNTPITRLSPELARISKIENNNERTQAFFDYLDEIGDNWPPNNTPPQHTPPPEDRPAGASFDVASDGVLRLKPTPAAQAEDLAALKDDCRDNARDLLEGLSTTNEHIRLRDDAAKYHDLIEQDTPDARRLYALGEKLIGRSAANDQVQQDRPTDALPPLIAAALKALTISHSVWAEDVPEIKAVKDKLRDPETPTPTPEQVAATDAVVDVHNSPERDGKQRCR